jgi:catechol-2,3-dioxygenase
MQNRSYDLFITESLIEKIEVKTALNFVTSIAFYFTDPDGNLIEVYWRTGIECLQLFFSEPIDLSQTEESIRAKPGLKA